MEAFFLFNLNVNGIDSHRETFQAYLVDVLHHLCENLLIDSFNNHLSWRVNTANLYIYTISISEQTSMFSEKCQLEHYHSSLVMYMRLIHFTRRYNV